jgi:hypothetical protein
MDTDALHLPEIVIMAKPLSFRPTLSVTHRIDEDRAQYIARKVVKLIQREKWPEILSALFGVMTHTLIRSANTVDEATESVDRLSADMKNKLRELWQARTGLDDAMDKLKEEDGGPQRCDDLSGPAGGTRRLPQRPH